MHTHGVPTGESAKKTRRVLQASLIATVAYVVLCLVAGLRAHSLSLVSEAGHNVSDAAALLLSFAALWLGSQPASAAKTFGYQRAGGAGCVFQRAGAGGRLHLDRH